MKTTTIVYKMRNESKEVKNSIGGTNAFRSIMNTVLANEIAMIGDFDDSRYRTNEEIAEIVEKKHTPEEIESVRNTYLSEKEGN